MQDKDLYISSPSGTLYLDYAYDLLGDITSQTAGYGTASYTYNTAARITSVSSSYSDPNNPATVFSGAHYNAFGGLTSDTLGDGETETYTYVPKLTRLQSYTATLSGTTIYSYNITSIAPNGDILTANDSANGNWTYTYDAFNRLVGSNKNSGQSIFSYVYDRFGNRWQQNGPNSMQLTFTGNNPGSPQNNNRMDGYSYDAAGNLLNDGLHSYTYDAENHLIKVDNGTTATYVYDANGYRVRRTGAASCSPDGILHYVYDLSGRWIVSVNSGFIACNYEIYAGSRHLASYYGDTLFHHTDWLGTERATVNYYYTNHGYSPTTCASLPFGDALSCTGLQTLSTLHFTGKERDSESGLDNFGARYYGSSLGRFMTPDWAARATAVPYADFRDPQSLNLYGYVRNNPISKADEDGHCGAPSGLQPGQVGICVASFIKSNTIMLIGRGDGRGPSGHGGTSRIETHLVVDPSKGTVTKSEQDKLGRSGIVAKEFGPKGDGKSAVSNVSTDKEGTTHFQVSQDASSAMSLGGLLLGNIDNHLNLDVTADQKVGIEAGSSAKDYPSLEVYSYTVDTQGNTTETQILFKQKSGNSSDLKKSEKPIKEKDPQ